MKIINLYDIVLFSNFEINSYCKKTLKSKNEKHYYFYATYFFC